MVCHTRPASPWWYLPGATPLFQHWGCVDSSLARNGHRVKWLSTHADYCHSVPFSGGAINGQTSSDMPLITWTGRPVSADLSSLIGLERPVAGESVLALPVEGPRSKRLTVRPQQVEESSDAKRTRCGPSKRHCDDPWRERPMRIIQSRCHALEKGDRADGPRDPVFLSPTRGRAPVNFCRGAGG